MPELPEVETIRRELSETVVGKRIVNVIINNPKVIRQPPAEKFKAGLINAVIKEVLRRAKVLVIALSNNKFLVIHLKMTGQLIYPGDGKKSRVTFCFADKTALDFNDARLFAELHLVDDWQKFPFIKQLGPEPQDITKEDFKKMLEEKKTQIKPLLMDQSFISGIGNLYAAEILFRAGIHPKRSAQSLTEKEKEKLFDAMREVIREAIKYHGSSVDQYVRLSGRPGDYVRYHKVYDRANQPCVVCKTAIKRITVGGRGTYFCPRCQQ
ncbi:MAG: bifunctional DNA-formamidopyrimidine glycosylase/DNA-(apurinic or apyrimidinic site) lyase [Candidatus Omnitrophica bacterium]|nr:bifunctional DNA-formamidopyrimidine glycosylase/DNA-(apurinic or apyrimidinic site) lyase [Candidatus Omnitrophota bacterium]